MAIENCHVLWIFPLNIDLFIVMWLYQKVHTKKCPGKKSIWRVNCSHKLNGFDAVPAGPKRHFCWASCHTFRHMSTGQWRYTPIKQSFSYILVVPTLSPLFSIFYHFPTFRTPSDCCSPDLPKESPRFMTLVFFPGPCAWSLASTLSMPWFLAPNLRSVWLSARGALPGVPPWRRAKR